jgi:methionyl-tRNA synthetase
MVAADNVGISPRELADRYNDAIREDLRALGISYDLFTRTTTRNHYWVVRDIFRALYDHGCLVEKTMLGAFSPTTGRTLPDRYIEGTCPYCGFFPARGDQCENCGRQLDPIDLKEPRSRIDGSVPQFRESTHLFLDLPAFADRLREWLRSKTHWRPNVRNFALALVDDLRPRAMTRDIDWGVPIPIEGWDDRDDKRIYVWFDAVVGYLSASVEWAHSRGEPEAWREWWQNPDARHAYFMGKDNIVFHAVIWPCMLLGYGEGGELGAGKGPLHLPDDVVASEYLTMERSKFSASRGIGVYVGDFLTRYDPDPLRYLLTAAGPETQDTDFTWSEFVRRNNDELLATWGNLVNRTLTSAYRNFGAVPDPGPLEADDEELLAAVAGGFATVGEQIEAARFKAALAEAIRLAGLVNQYATNQAPWSTIKTDRKRAGTVLYICLRCIDSLKIVFTPFLPFTSQLLHELLGYEGFIAGPLEFREEREEDGSTHVVLTGDYSSWVGRWEPSELPPGQPLREPRPLFKKLDPEQVVAGELARMVPPEDADAA